MLETNQIYNGDCLQLLKQIDANSVDLIVVDPPYNINYFYLDYNDNRSAGDYLWWCFEWLSEAKRVLKSTGTLWLISGIKYASELDVMCKREVKLQKRTDCIWYYTFGQACKTNFSPCHVRCMYYTISDNFTWNTDEIKVKSKRQILGDKRAAAGGKTPDNVWIDIPRVCGNYKERLKGVPNQLPEALLERIILSTSNVGDLVFDPMSGSFTTCAVAKKLKRNFIGFELSNQYFEIGKERLNKIAT